MKEAEEKIPLMWAKDTLHELYRLRWKKQLQPHKIRRDPEPEEEIEISHVGYDAEQMGREK